MQTIVQDLKNNLDKELKSRGMVVNWDMYLDREKQQIKDAYRIGYIECDENRLMQAEKYYNKTHGSKQLK